ncbi:hypothetical protein GCM10010340_13440 [Streptomyces griseoloalbus]|nr:hypothetical protein GCM10010340_13440 [Streptomyces albaduncus]
MQHEGLGGTVGQQPPGGSAAAVAAQHDPAPALTPPAESGAEPAVALAAAGLPGDALPVARYVVHGRPLPRRAADAVGGVADDEAAGPGA